MSDPNTIVSHDNLWKYIRRIAIVEDDAIVAEALCALLDDMGLRTEVSSTGVSPRLLEDFDPDLILLDVGLGVTDAFAILRSQIPPSYRGVISIVSAMGVDVVMDAVVLGEKMGLRMGIPALKPFSHEEILNLLLAADELLERRSIGESIAMERKAAPTGQDLRLRQAMDEDRLEVWYQPKFEMVSGDVAGAEALIRARAADGRIVTPYELLRDSAKEDMLQLTEHVIKTAIDHSKILATFGFQKRLSVNTPISYLLQGDPCRLLREVKTSKSYSGLIFEITEDEALNDILELQLISTQLSLYSVALSVDDFGSAYSSLSRLRDLRFQELKLDRSFVHGCSGDSTRRVICASVLALGAELGVTTVAEGVEEEADMRYLADLGCDQAQGFLYAKPMPFEDLAEFIRTKLGHRSDPAVLMGCSDAPVPPRFARPRLRSSSGRSRL